MLDPAALNHNATSILIWMLRASLSAAGVAVIILTVQLLFSRWLSPRWRYRLWVVLVLRLLLPALPSSSASLANLNLEDRAVSVWTRLTAAPKFAPRPTHSSFEPFDEIHSTPGLTVTVVKEPLSPAPTTIVPQTALAPVAQPRPSLTPPLLLGAWISVAVILLARLLISNLSLARRLKTAQIADAEMQALLKDCCAEIGVRTPPELLVTDEVTVPAAAGVFRARILIPPGLLESLSRDELRAIFLHELAHIRRHDVAVNWLLALIQIVHWFNPIVWIAFARLRADRELARDAMVLSLSKQTDPRDYVQTLLKLTESLSKTRFPDLLAPTPHVAVGMYGGKNGLKRRLHMIARLPQSRRRFDWTGPLLSIALVCALLTSAKSQTRDAASPPSTQPTLPLERHQIKVPVLSEIPILGRLFTNQSYAPATRPADPEKVATPSEISRVDPQMERLLNQLREINVKIETSAALGDKNAAVSKLQSELAIRQKSVDDHAAQFNREYVIEKRPDGSLVASPKDQSAIRRAGKDQQIADLALRSRTLSESGRYREALQTVDQILVLDPKNDYAVGVRPLLEDKVQFAQQRNYLEHRASDILRYPTDWQDASQVKDPRDPKQPEGAEGKPDEAQKKVLAQLDKSLPALQFDAVGFGDVIDFLRDISGANIFVNWKSLEAAKIDRNSPVSANLRNIKFSKALGIILDSVGGQTKLGYGVEEGVITISTQGDFDRNVVVRVYDIRDLIVVIPEFTAGTDNAKPAPATQPVTRERLVQAITKLIIDTVSTDSWKDHGGSVGALRELEGQLIITQTPENHKQVVQLLEQIRQERSLQTTVETRFVYCDHKIMDRLISEWNRSDTPPAEIRPATRPADSGRKSAGIFLTDAQVGQFLKLVQSDSDSITTTAPRITLFNGQRAYVRVATSKAYLSGYTPTTKGDGEVRYEPVVKSAENGILLDLTSTVSSDRRFVTVSLHPQVTTVAGFDRVPWPGSPKNVDLMVQEPRIKTSEINTTLSIPDGGSALLVGLDNPKFETESSGQPATRPAASRGIYLLVRPTVIRGEPQQAGFPQFDKPIFTSH